MKREPPKLYQCEVNEKNWTPCKRDEFEELAAKFQYDAGMSRESAEKRARLVMEGEGE